MDLTTIAALITALVGGACGVAGLVQSGRQRRSDDASQLLADHRALVDEYRQQHGQDLAAIEAQERRITALEEQVSSLQEEHRSCQERLKNAEQLLAAAGIAP